MQTDPRIWREYRQASSTTPYTLPVREVKLKQAFGEDNRPPEAPVAVEAASASTAHTPRLAMLLPCSRPRKSYPPDEEVQSNEELSNSVVPVRDASLHSPSQDSREIRGLPAASSNSTITGFQGALAQVQTAVVALLSPRSAQRSPASSQCLSPRSTL